MQTAQFASNEIALNIRKIGSVDVFGFIFLRNLPMFQQRSLELEAVDLAFIRSNELGFHVLKKSVGAMFLRISRNSARIIAILSQHRKPAQIAWGIAIGIMLGLIPKDNLVALSLIAALACLRVNQLVACGTAAAISLLSGWFSPTTNYVGCIVLDQPSIVGCITYLYRFPLLPWSCLENSLVLGGICVGLVTLLPTYAICWRSFSKAQQQMESIALEQVANEAIEYRKSVSDQSRTRKEKPSPALKLLSDDNSDAIEEPTLLVEQSSVKRMPLLSLAKSESVDAKPSNPESFPRMEHNSKQRTIPTLFTGEIIPDGNDTFLRETVIEVVRYRRPAHSTGESSKSKHAPPISSQTQGLSMPVGNATTVDSRDTSNKGLAASNKANLPEQSIAFDSGHTPNLASNRDESLRYLLWHINGSRESVRKSSEKTA